MRFLVLLSLVLMCASWVRPLEVRESVADCAQRDDDNDLVDNCRDKCPNSKPDERIAPDGCPAVITIERVPSSPGF